MLKEMLRRLPPPIASKHHSCCLMINVDAFKRVSEADNNTGLLGVLIEESLHARKPFASTMRDEAPWWGYEEGPVAIRTQLFLQQAGITFDHEPYRYFRSGVDTLAEVLMVTPVELALALTEAPPGGIRAAFADTIGLLKPDITSEQRVRLIEVGDDVFSQSNTTRSVTDQDREGMIQQWQEALR
jgi:hypothetical protein